jgi:hypothetical protein
MSDEPKKQGWFQRWLGKDDIVDQPITVDDFEKPSGGDDDRG